MSNYKPGDKVVRIIGKFISPGTKAVIVSKCSEYPKDYIVKTENGPHNQNWHKSSFVSEEVYNSPLFEALREKK